MYIVNIGLGPSEKPESRPEVMGNWEDYWSDVERSSG